MRTLEQESLIFSKSGIVSIDEIVYIVGSIPLKPLYDAQTSGVFLFNGRLLL